MRKVLLGSMCALVLVGCNTVADKLRTPTLYVFTIYVKGYQPALLPYDRLPTCGQPASPPCKDPVLYKKLYEADAAAVGCMKAAKVTLELEFPDMTLVNSCIQKVEVAKATFVGAGVAPQDVEGIEP